MKSAVQNIDAIAKVSPRSLDTNALSQIQAILTKLQAELSGAPPAEPEKLVTVAHELRLLTWRSKVSVKGM